MLSHIPIKISSRIGICTFNENKSNQIIEELKEHFQQHGICKYALEKHSINTFVSFSILELTISPNSFGYIRI